MDLNEPLGMTPTPRRPRRFGLVIGLALGATVTATLVYGLLTANPRGGEPYAMATIARPPPKPAAPPAAPLAPDPMVTGSLPQPGRPPVDPGSLEGGVKVYRGRTPGAAPATAVMDTTGMDTNGMDTNGATGDLPAGGPLIIDVSRALDKGKRSMPGGLARSSPTGPAVPKPGPRIAIFVGGMGLATGATRAAIDTMPPAVTLAFVPNGDDVTASVESAKIKGHEILVQLPMQSGDAAGLGPHSLRADASPATLNADLDWLLTRFKGYDGVTNLLGAAVTGKAGPMTGVLKAVGARGLFFVDDGTSRRSLATSLAPGFGVTATQVDVVLDATADPAVVRANFDALIATARRKGAAIGMASGLPEHMAAIARYAGELGSQGIALVPVGVIARGAQTGVAAR